MIQLTEKEFVKLSDITGIPHHDIQKLYVMGILNEAVTLDHLIKYDFDTIRHQDKYRPGQIITRLADYYAVSKNKVKQAAYRKEHQRHFCEQCGKKIKASEFTRNNGLCDNCVAKSIEV